MPSAYLETSFVSACVSNRTDLASVYRQQVSTKWLELARPRYYLCTSEIVIAELSDPRYPNSRTALGLVADLPVLELTPAATALATLLIRRKAMPQPIIGDAAHVAIAAMAGVEVLVTWNVKHLANPSKSHHVNAICLEHGAIAPRIVRPDDLLEFNDET